MPDRYIEGICPKCGYDQARSDECKIAVHFMTLQRC
ncbi:MAG: class I tRNA ligase family protein [Ignavibacteriales bacterium]|nr:class I tRNA ligase family protein [Ignavibacteriales bacterium]